MFYFTPLSVRTLAARGLVALFSGLFATVVAAQSLSLQLVSATPSTCTANGALTVLASGGTSPYAYKLVGTTRPTQSTGAFPNLQPSTYTVQVTDNAGATATQSVLIQNQYTPMAGITAALTNQTDVALTLTGGRAPFRYSYMAQGDTALWTNGHIQNSPQFNCMPNGTWLFIIYDACGNTAAGGLTTTDRTFSFTPIVVNNEIRTQRDDLTNITWSYISSDGTSGSNTMGVFPNVTGCAFTVTGTSACGAVQTRTVSRIQSVTARLVGCVNWATGDIDRVEATGDSPPFTYSYRNPSTGVVTTNTTGVFANALPTSGFIKIKIANSCNDSIIMKIYYNAPSVGASSACNNSPYLQAGAEYYYPNTITYSNGSPILFSYPYVSTNIQTVEYLGSGGQLLGAVTPTNTNSNYNLPNTTPYFNQVTHIRVTNTCGSVSALMPVTRPTISMSHSTSCGVLSVMPHIYSGVRTDTTQSYFALLNAVGDTLSRNHTGVFSGLSIGVPYRVYYRLNNNCQSGLYGPVTLTAATPPIYSLYPFSGVFRGQCSFGYNIKTNSYTTLRFVNTQLGIDTTYNFANGSVNFLPSGTYTVSNACINDVIRLHGHKPLSIVKVSSGCEGQGETVRVSGAFAYRDSLLVEPTLLGRIANIDDFSNWSNFYYVSSAYAASFYEVTYITPNNITYNNQPFAATAGTYQNSFTIKSGSTITVSLRTTFQYTSNYPVQPSCSFQTQTYTAVGYQMPVLGSDYGVLCPGDVTSTLTPSVSGGVPPYTFSIDPADVPPGYTGQTVITTNNPNAVFTNLPTGDYTLYVRDNCFTTVDFTGSIGPYLFEPAYQHTCTHTADLEMIPLQGAAYHWEDASGATIGNTRKVSITNLTTNTYYLTVTLSGCSYTHSIVVPAYIDPPPADAGIDMYIDDIGFTPNMQVTMAATLPAGSTGQWITPSGINAVGSSTSPTASFSVASLGKYPLIWVVTTPYGCELRDTTKILVRCLRTIQPIYTPICGTSEVDVTLTAIPSFTKDIRMVGSNGAFYSFINTIRINNPDSMTYHVSVISPYGCTYTAILFIPAINPVTVPAQTVTTDFVISDITTQLVYTLAAVQPAPYDTGTWAVVAGSAVITNPDSLITDVTLLEPGNYSFEWRVVHANGCEPTSQFVNVTVSCADTYHPSFSGHCDGNVYLDVENKSGASYNWVDNNTGGMIGGNPTETYTPLHAVGEYTVSINRYGCNYNYSLQTGSMSIDNSQILAGIDLTVDDIAQNFNFMTDARYTNQPFDIGVWTQITGPVATIDNINNPQANITLPSVDNYAFEWRFVRASGCVSTDTFYITKQCLNTTSISVARNCANPIEITTTSLPSATYTWSDSLRTNILGNQPNIAVPFIDRGLYRIIIDNVGCIYEDSVTVESTVVNTLPNDAGNDYTIYTGAPVLDFITNASIASGEIGQWLQIAGPTAIIQQPYNPITDITLPSVDTYSFVWQITRPSGCVLLDTIEVLTRIGVSLPVKLLNFDAVYLGKNVKTSWRTATEINTSHFMVERSTDAKTFQSIARVNATGNTNTAHFYRLDDPNPPFGTLYYRLKMVDNDASFEYSNIVTLHLSSEGVRWLVYPNPTDNEVILQTDTPTTAALYNTTGQLLQTIILANGENIISLSDLPAAIYYLKDLKGGRTVKIVKL